MSSDIIGKFLGLALTFVLLIVAPFVERSAQKEALDSKAIVSDINNFIDEVVDSRMITDNMLKQLNSKLASYSILVDYEIIREKRAVNPDPKNPGEYYSSLIVVDDNMTYEQGDHITVHVYKIGNSSTSVVSARLAQIFIPEFDYKFSARVR